MKNQSFSALKTHLISKTSNIENLLILVHGRTGNIRLLEWYSKRLQIPDLSYLLIEAPFEDRREGQTEPGFSWYLKGFEGLEDSRTRLTRLLEEIEAVGVDSKNIYWLGFSQGAVMGLDFALRSSFRLGGFVCVSGICIQTDDYPKAFGPHAKNQRLLITHGTRDEIIAEVDARRSYEELRALGIPYEYLVFDKPHSFHLKQEVPLIEERLKSWMASS